MPARSCNAPAEAGACTAAILDAAAGLMAEVGFGGMSMRQLAERAGMLPGSLYHHVTGKQDLLLLVLLEVLDRRLAAWRVRRDKRELRSYVGFLLARQRSHPVEESLLRHELRHLLPEQRRWVTQRQARLHAPLLAIIDAGVRGGQFVVADRQAALAGVLALVTAAADLRQGAADAQVEAWVLGACQAMLEAPG